DGPSSDGKGHCTFTRGAYHTGIQKTFYEAFCLAHAIQFRDFTFQVQMTILKGSSGGIVFGADDMLQTFYQFYILKNSYSCVLVYSNNDGLVLSAFPLLISCPDTSHQPILLTIIVKYSYIYMFANKKYVASIKADKYSSGEIGVTG